MRLLIASTNPGKIREYGQIFGEIDLETLGLRTIGLDTLVVDEPYATFEQNAIHKARTYAQASGLTTMADDSGLEVDALDGRPGVYTARYAGEGASDQDRYTKLLKELRGVPDEQRRARFVCVIAVAQASGDQVGHVRGECTGRIAHAPGEGDHGFGFDPVFIPDGYDTTFNTLPPGIKNQISHRGRATQLILPILAEMAKAT